MSETYKWLSIKLHKNYLFDKVFLRGKFYANVLYLQIDDFTSRK